VRLSCVCRLRTAVLYALALLMHAAEGVRSLDSDELDREVTACQPVRQGEKEKQAISRRLGFPYPPLAPLRPFFDGVLGLRGAVGLWPLVNGRFLFIVLVLVYIFLGIVRR
jgi:hypothetical protein